MRSQNAPASTRHIAINGADDSEKKSAMLTRAARAIRAVTSRSTNQTRAKTPTQNTP